MRTRLAVLPGDDIGPEIVDAALAVLRAADARFDLGLDVELHEVGMAAHRRHGTTLPEATIVAAAAADGVLLGPCGMTAYPPAKDGGINVPGTIRKRLKLGANIRPARSRASLPRAVAGLDCVVVRENTEGFYADRSLHQGNGEFMPTPDVAISLRLITAGASRAIARAAFELAATRRRRVTVIGKRHVLQVTDGLFMREVEAVARGFPDIALGEMDIDAMVAEIYTRPERFDVLLTTNMFGDILSNLCAALSGGLGLAAALNVGPEHAVANAGHGSAPDIAGRGIANPTAIILSSAMLLRWLAGRGRPPRFETAAAEIERAVDTVLANPRLRTVDLGGETTTSGFGAAVSACIG